MNWEAIGAIADLVATTAVVISLGYLSVQIRRQTVETKLATGNEFASQLNQVFTNLSDNADLADLFFLGINDFESLRPGQKIQISTYFMRMLRIVESVFHQHHQGRIDATIWTGLDREIQDICQYPGLKSWWGTRKHWFSEDFAAYVSVYIASESKPNSFWEE